MGGREPSTTGAIRKHGWTGAGWTITVRDEASKEQHTYLGQTATVFQAEVTVIDQVASGF